MISIVAVINIACEPSYIMKNFCNTTIPRYVPTKTIRTRFAISPSRSRSGLVWDFLCSRTITDWPLYECVAINCQQEFTTTTHSVISLTMFSAKSNQLSPADFRKGGREKSGTTYGRSSKQNGSTAALAPSNLCQTEEEHGDICTQNVL